MVEVTGWLQPESPAVCHPGGREELMETGFVPEFAVTPAPVVE